MSEVAGACAAALDAPSLAVRSTGVREYRSTGVHTYIMEYGVPVQLRAESPVYYIHVAQQRTEEIDTFV